MAAPRNVLVSGAARGIGLAIAQAFSACGDHVFMLDRDPSITAAAAQLSATPLCCDITDAEALAHALAGLRRIDVLVHNAGIQPGTPIADPSPSVDATIRAILEVNVIGSFNMIRKCLGLIPKRGSIILTASIWGKIGAPGYSAYSASKHAVIGLARSLAEELGPRQIRINTVCPGLVETEGVLEALDGEAAQANTTRATLIADAIAKQAIKQPLPVEDVAALYVFLASDAARGITGQSLTVDLGGITI
jgi:3-hydroxybutyrate dehydrogenase